MDQSIEANEIALNLLLDKIYNLQKGNDKKLYHWKLMQKLLINFATTNGINNIEYQENNEGADYDVIKHNLYLISKNVIIELQEKQKKRNKWFLVSTKNYTEDNYSNKDLSLGAIASHIGISNSYLSTMFSEAYNVKFTTYLNNLRIEKAKEQLSNDDLRIKDVASNVGFTTIQTFTRVFKEIVGITPSDYKKILKKQNNYE
jgi:AraC-like DNA-binding protein